MQNDDNENEDISIPEKLPVLPARDLVAFPSVMMSLHVGRDLTINAIEKAVDSDSLIFVVAQKDEDVENPKIEDLYQVGVVCNIVRTLKMPDGHLKVLLQGLTRATAKKIYSKTDFLEAELEDVPPVLKVELTEEQQKTIDRIRENLQLLVQQEHLPEEMLLVSEDMEDPGALADVILAHYKLEPQEAQAALEELDPISRLDICDKIISDDLHRLVVAEEMRNRARDELFRGQQEIFLKEQLRQIQKELGESDDSSEDLEALKESLEKKKLPEQAKKEVDRQLSRLERMHAESSEYAITRTYLEWVNDLPWSAKTKDRLSLKKAEEVLNKDHFGLDKAKDRILEFLSVRKLKKNSKGPILCFVGPPGVGKTSLGRSIATALNRKFVRISLGGVRDEAEIRGHRRTYVGALPGRIIQGLKQAGSSNPVFLLDELDKVGADFRGDPASALLEVLDPEQNKDFVDHYLSVGYDLSSVLFVATANTIDTIPDALLDRLEVIYISSYTTEEKIKISQRYLIPRQLEENGLQDKPIKFQTEAIRFLIERYTREAGVRNLEREIGSATRKIARELAESDKFTKNIDIAFIEQKLGTTKYDPEEIDDADRVGMARGLAWTVFGGEVMPVEASIAKGKGSLMLTGSLGDVMRESAQAALFYARANAKHLGLDLNFISKHDIHIHVPSGATPKDGPSAGITIATALVSALSGKKVSRKVAMTGEITLRGTVLPIGGLKEKALAALRYGIKDIIIPFDNQKDLADIPDEQRKKLNFYPAKHIDEVIEIALIGAKKIKTKAKT
ncbi:MAG: endopeptidase La, partial [Bdellovibrionales bacterium]|nr:endopeptidase La [Bdellovibrionales bacterium]